MPLLPYVEQFFSRVCFKLSYWSPDRHDLKTCRRRFLPSHKSQKNAPAAFWSGPGLRTSSDGLIELSFYRLQNPEVLISPELLLRFVLGLGTAALSHAVALRRYAPRESGDAFKRPTAQVFSSGLLIVVLIFVVTLICFDLSPDLTRSEGRRVDIDVRRIGG